ncbi:MULTISPECIES: glycosyltransferase family 4 protein [unclassified Vibrio]|uniref:glycosyltransferase family 4 protein n=1 Tax=unclassified Vibrio TaxID=2614977 RepID=UPI0035511DEE
MSKTRKKILIIGPFPDPIHGMSLANLMLFEYFRNSNLFNVSKFDISIGDQIKSKQEQGKFDFFYFLFSCLNLINGCIAIIISRRAILYITPPQSALGFIRTLPFIILSKILSKKTIVHFHGSRLKINYNNTNFIFKGLIKLGLLCADRVIFLGDSIRNDHIELVDKKKSVVCWNGVDRSSTIELGYEKNKIDILFLSNLMKDKGIFDFLDAVKKLDPNKYNIHIAGSIEPCFKEEISDVLSALSGRLKFYGPVYGDQKWELFNLADIFVLPSYDEGQPLSILEAYSCGCSVVTTNVGGIADIFKDGDNGLFCKVSDANDIADKIQSLGPNDLDRISMFNRKIYFDCFTTSAFCARIENIIG